MKYFFIAILNLLFIFAGTISAFAGYRVVAGSNIALKVSGDFVQAKRFSGMLDVKRSIAIVAAQFPAAQFENLKNGFSRKKLGRKLLRVDEIGKLDQRQDEHIFVRGVQRTPVGDFVKLILVFRSVRLTAMVNINLPQKILQDDPKILDVLKTVLVNARIATKTRHAELPVHLSYQGPFQLSRQQTGVARTYTAIVKDKGQNTSALMVVAPSKNHQKVKDLSRAGESILKKMAIVSHLTVNAVQAVSLSSGEGVEYHATAKAQGSGKKLFVYQFLKPVQSGGYIRLLGLCDYAFKDRFSREYRKVVDGMKSVLRY